MAAESKRRDRQVVRILGILGALLQGSRPSVHDLARRFGTRRETIYRDLRALEDAGYQVAGDDDGHLSRPQLLSDAKRTPQIRFTPEELNALDWAAAHAGSGPFSKALDGARRKLQAMSVALGQEGVSLAEVTDSWGPAAPSTSPEILIRLAEAILRRRICRITYRTPESAEPKTYSYHPYRLLSVAGAFYCVGKVPPYAGLTTLATHRIGAIELLADSFVLDSTVDVSRHRLEAFGVAWEEPIRVVLRFRADQAPYVRERIWHDSQRIRDLDDGGIELTFKAGGLFEMTRWILGWGDAVEVVEPSELRTRIKEIHRSAAIC